MKVGLSKRKPAAADGMRSIRFNIAVHYSRAKTEETVPNARTDTRSKLRAGLGRKVVFRTMYFDGF
jgi:hypothetical protein